MDSNWGRNCAYWLSPVPHRRKNKDGKIEERKEENKKARSIYEVDTCIDGVYKEKQTNSNKQLW